MMEKRMIIIGAGAAGLSAALKFAENGVKSILVSDMPSERAQSVMAEGGINAAANTETDSPELHETETMKIYSRSESCTPDDSCCAQDY